MLNDNRTTWKKITFDEYFYAKDRPTIEEGKILQELIVNLAKEKGIEYRILYKTE